MASHNAIRRLGENELRPRPRRRPGKTYSAFVRFAAKWHSSHKFIYCAYWHTDPDTIPKSGCSIHRTHLHTEAIAM